MVLGRKGSRQIGPLANWAPSDFCGKLGPGRLGPGKLGPRQIGPRKILGAANWAPENLLVANWAPANWAPADWAPWRQIGPLEILFRQTGLRQTGPRQIGPPKKLGAANEVYLNNLGQQSCMFYCSQSRRGCKRGVGIKIMWALFGYC